MCNKKLEREKQGYHGIHKWVSRKYGKASKCEFCGVEGLKTYNWANLDHKHSRDIKDWRQLCPSCHIKYDIKNNGRKFFKKNSNNNPLTFK
jgi:hypothetical protein